MPVQVQSDLLGREYQLRKSVLHRDGPVKPRSKPVTPDVKRKPLVKSRLAMVAKNESLKKARRLPSDETVFYSNIWSPPATARDDPVAKKSKQLVDISQVAHVLTTIDYKSGYDGPSDAEFFNIWASLESQQNAIAAKTAMLSKTQQSASNLSTPISEHSSEESSSVVTSSVLSLGPLRMDANTLRKEFAADDFSNVMSAPVSAPAHKKENVVFSTVLTRNNEVDMSWNSQFLLGLHEPVRHALYVIDQFLERSRNLTSPMNWNVSEFFSWFKLHFIEFVRNQRDVKMKVILPLVVIKFVEKRDIVALYQAIFALVDVIIAQEDDLVFSAASSADSWQTRLGMLQDDIRRLNHLLFNVLGLEEEAFKPAIELAFSETAFQRYVMPRVFRATKPKRVMVPWIVERSRVWGGTKVAKAYKDDLSFTARFMYDHVWHPYFDTHIASAMKHLDNAGEGVTANGSEESWFGCSVM
ncbi:hypothetical protein PHYSODRAFT_293856 [Phytophthora sojae]|uniref:Uncharacterized protein n=1 Tax=Phytophthora sojae (strain P6497) TaxID=1094619 RepID=G4YME5_PHYSP|nr:hypothetical protein PHYSODRAFT_293856 [Phytophthora sojae]EGZ28275.1 hypothetical protein PHYSODRAFT_293856 [Phytophthora sojae]|eukprot:XP_009515550.1 hypothetical protein PHYSODRAFT_293856 [Phytophthora sojae]